MRTIVITKKQSGAITVSGLQGGTYILPASCIVKPSETGEFLEFLTGGVAPFLTIPIAKIKGTQIEGRTLVAYTNIETLIDTLSDSFFFDLGAGGKIVLTGAVFNVPSGAGVQTLIDYTVSSNATYFLEILNSARVSTERWTLSTPNYVRIYVASNGIITLDNGGAASLFETFTTNPTFAFSVSPNRLLYTVNCGTNVNTSVQVTMNLTKHQY